MAKDINISLTDSTSLLLINELGDTLLNAFIMDEIIFTNTDSLNYTGIPAKVVFESDNFTGRIEYQIIII